MNLQELLSSDAIAFSIQDKDGLFEYLLTLQALGAELAVQMEVEPPQFQEFEDETGTYIIGYFDTRKVAINYIDLLMDAILDPELDIDLHHIQIYTEDSFIYQRYMNFKQTVSSNLLLNMFSDVNEDGDIVGRMLSIEQLINYNCLDKFKSIINVVAHAMDSNDMPVSAKINELVTRTLH